MPKRSSIAIQEVVRDGKKYYRYQPRSLDDKNRDKRLTFYLGTRKGHALERYRHIRHLIEATRHGSPIIHAETQNWLRTSAPVKLIAQLVKHGICQPIEVCPTLAEFIDDFFESKPDASPATLIVYGNAKRHLLAHFKPETRIDQISARDADEFCRWLRNQHLADRPDSDSDSDNQSKKRKARKLGNNTIAKRISVIRQMFNRGIDLDLLTKNPFKAKRTTQTPAKKSYVEWSTITKVIEHCPSAEWKLLFAMSRSIPIRLPSEIRELKWTDVDFEGGKILIRSPKTAGAGKDSRLVPVMAKFRDYLLQLRSESDVGGAVYVFRTLRTHTNLSTTARKFVAKAGLKAWDKFWNTLRASALTDLLDSHGIRLGCMFAGNSPAIAMRNYALVRSEDFVMDVGPGSSLSASGVGVMASGMANSTARGKAESVATITTDTLDAATATITVSTIESTIENTDLEFVVAKSVAEPKRMTTNVAEQETKNPGNTVYSGALMDGIGLEPTTSTMSTWRSNQLN